MYANQFHNFLLSTDNLQVYERGELLYSSDKDLLVPWLEYIDMFAPYVQRTVIFDKIIGNASALLAVMAGCRKLCSALGSRLAVLTLEKYHIKYQFIQTAPYIHGTGGKDMCPLEKLSLNKAPEEFYESIRYQLLLEHQGI